MGRRHASGADGGRRQCRPARRGGPGEALRSLLRAAIRQPGGHPDAEPSTQPNIRPGLRPSSSLRRTLATNVGTRAGPFISSGRTGKPLCARATANASPCRGHSFLMEYPAWHRKSARLSACACRTTRSMSQPGYYFAFGDTLDELADQLTLVRLYFHCSPESAVLLVGELTAALNRFQTPFQLKTPAAPALYGRTDAAVLYIGARYFPITARIVASVLSRVPLETATPLFTKRLWPGVGAAVEPGSGESFGSHRCRLTAEGIVDAWRQDGAQETPKRMAAVAARFAAAGLDLQRPGSGRAASIRLRSPAPRGCRDRRTRPLSRRGHAALAVGFAATRSGGRGAATGWAGRWRRMADNGFPSIAP